jgi:hypothetical protein
MRKQNKKGIAFNTINAGMISFVAFTMIVLLTVLLVSVTKQTSIVCEGSYNDGVCNDCPAGFSINGTTNCINSTAGDLNTTAIIPFTGAAWNASLELQEAAGLPPQFASIIVIVIIIVGILAMLAFIGFGAVSRLRR